MFKYPYSNLHELNLDWILNTMRKVEETTTELTKDVNIINERICKNGKPAINNYVNINDYIPIGETGDITEFFGKAYSEGHRAFYFPTGEYLIKFPVGVDFNIKGDGKFNTIINAIPNSEGAALVINSDMSGLYFDGFTIKGADNEIAKSMDGLKVVGAASKMDFCIFNNVRFTAFANALRIMSRAIWNSFYDCDFYGNYSNGLTVDSASITNAFNNNSFYSCRFSNNKNYGIYINGNEEYSSINTLFIGCNIEYNGYVFHEWGGSDVAHTLFFNNVDSVIFDSCYFESNSVSERNKVITFINASNLKYTNCSFVTETKPFFNGSSGSVNIVGCYGRGNNTSLTLSTVNELFIYCDCIGALNLTNENFTGIAVLNQLNFKYTNLIKLTGSEDVTSVTPNTANNPVFVLTGDYAPVIDSGIMITGQPLQLEPNSAYSFMLLNGKLYQIK